MTTFDPGEIALKSLTKTFEYEKISRELDACDDVKELRNAAKCFLKLCMKTQETVDKITEMR